jgi:iron(III) transport system substrate-binding protein
MATVRLRFRARHRKDHINLGGSAQLRAKEFDKQGYPLPLDIAWPAEGAIAIQRPVAISLNGARPAVNQRIAEDLVRFLVSEPAQRAMLNFGFVSVREGLPMPQGMPSDPPIYRVDWETLSEQQDRIAQEFAALFN